MGNQCTCPFVGEYGELYPDAAVCVMLFGGDWCYWRVQDFGVFLWEGFFDSLGVVSTGGVAVSCIYTYHDVYSKVFDEC